MSSILRVTTTLLVAGCLVAGCGGGAATASHAAAPTATPAPQITLAPRLLPTAPPTSVPTALPNGWARVVMTGPGRFSVVDQGKTDPTTGLITGVKITATGDSLSDPRVNGTVNITENWQTDSSGELGYGWSTVTIENAGGSWAGTCRGMGWATGNESVMNCWLTGRGGYAGFTYAYTAHNTVTAIDEFTGLIYRGSPPTP